MKKSALISIVLPTYNGSRHIETSIKSCINQTYENWELIVVDDASTDATHEIVSEMANTDERIQYIRHDKNRRLPAALNTGFKRTHGDYFSWISDDNCYRSTAMERMLKFLEENPQTDIVYTDYTIIDEKGIPQASESVRPPEELTSGNVVGASFLHKREVYESLGGYDENLFLVEDYDFWLRASLTYNIAPLHEDLYLLRYHDLSLTSLHSPEIYKMHEKLLSYYLPRMNQFSSEARAMGFLTAADLSKKRGDIGATFLHLVNALRENTSLLILDRVLKFVGHALVGKRISKSVSVPYRMFKHTVKYLIK